MTRVKISICLLLLLTAVSVFSGIWVNRRCSSLAEKAIAVCDAFEKNDVSAAVEAAVQLENEWEDMRVKASVLLKYDRLFEIDRIAAHASFITAERSEDVLPQMAELIHMLYILSENEIPYMNSVL